MAGLSTGLKKLLTITSCDVAAGKVTPSTVSADIFKVMLNPSEFTHKLGLSYSGGDCDSKKPIGQSSVETKFSSAEAEEMSFDLVLDGTGVVNLPVPPLGSPVKDQIEQLKKVTYDYDGEEHEPRVVELVWGEFKFEGRLKSMSVKYTLFKPNGDPLRAKTTLSFVSFMSAEEEALTSDKKSPDLTHIVEVKAGDTLPLLCYRIYKNCSYYMEVARANSITNFQDIKPGTKLHFPPVR